MVFKRARQMLKQKVQLLDRIGREMCSSKTIPNWPPNKGRLKPDLYRDQFTGSNPKMQSPLYETLKHTATAHIEAYASPNPWDEHAIWKLRTPDCLHYLHPVESIPPPFNGAIDESGHRNFMRFFGPIFDRCEFEIKDLVVDEWKRTVVAMLKATFDFKAIGDEPAEQGWTAEYVWLTEMTDDGTKIKRVEEFMDPARLLGYVAVKAQKYADLTKT